MQEERSLRIQRNDLREPAVHERLPEAFDPARLARELLVGQFRYALGRYSWEIPEGGVPFDEDPLVGARRELAEETGCTAETWREIARFDLSNSVTDEHGLLYVATGLSTGDATPDETEAIDVLWVPFDEALAMIDRGEITDAMSQIGLDQVARLRSIENRGSSAMSG